MSTGARAAFAVVVFAIAWDMVCRPGQTLSEAVARGLADKRTRWPLAATILAVLMHLVALARKPDDDGVVVDMKEYAALRNLSWPA